MRGKLGFLLTVVGPGLALVALATHAIREEDRLLDRERAARSAALATSLRDALRDQILGDAKRADLALRGALREQRALTPPAGVLYVDRGLDLVAPAPAWSAETPDVPLSPDWLRPLLVLEVDTPDQALTALAGCTDTQRTSPAGLDLEARLAARTSDPERALRADAALIGVGRARQRRVGRLRRLALLTRLGRRPAAKLEAESALADLLRTGGAGETPDSLWFALEGLTRRATSLGISAIDSRVIALRELALSAAQIRALGDLEQARGLWALDAQFRVAPRRGGGWLVVGPPAQAGTQALRIVLPLTRHELSQRLVGLAKGRTGAEAEALLHDELGAPLGLGVFVLIRPRETQAGAQLALRRGQQRLAVVGGLVLLVLVGAAFTWRSLRRAAELARLRADFVASVTHELRTPLASIRANADVLILGKVPDPEDQREFLEAIASETKRLSRLVDDVLDASRIERGAFTVEVQPSSLPAVIKATIEALGPLAREEGFQLEGEAPDDLPTVLLDPLLFPRALENLIVNAIRYSKGEQRVNVRAQTAGEWVEVSVCDQGVGIPAADQARLFERFVRGSTSEGTTGTGLGLAIVEQIALAQGGSLRLESASGQGATFTIRLKTFQPEDLT
ncbi:MAG: HAMP domain-containing histidine kinase [Planctomycetes bacterium]|nr:HAMP domain-containing histidine kinase [Planctomycetota bacterium]